MKRIFFLSGLFFLSIVVFHYFIKADPEAYPWEIGSKNCDKIYNECDLLLTVDDRTLSSYGAVFLFENLGEEEVFYDENEYWIQIKIKGQWYNIEKYYDWALEMVSLDPDNKVDFSVDWSAYYGKLPSGTYRLIKEMSRCDEILYLSCEFEI